MELGSYLGLYCILSPYPEKRFEKEKYEDISSDESSDYDFPLEEESGEISEASQEYEPRLAKFDPLVARRESLFDQGMAKSSRPKEIYRQQKRKSPRTRFIQNPEQEIKKKFNRAYIKSRIESSFIYKV